MGSTWGNQGKGSFMKRKAVHICGYREREGRGGGLNIWKRSEMHHSSSALARHPWGEELWSALHTCAPLTECQGTRCSRAQPGRAWNSRTEGGLGSTCDLTGFSCPPQPAPAIASSRSQAFHSLFLSDISLCPSDCCCNISKRHCQMENSRVCGFSW